MADLPLRPAPDGAARPTLKTIAQMTGLAVATVSRALNDAPDIGGETKRRVHECAERIGYRPNRAGVRLRTGKTNVISLVLATEHDMMSHTARLLTAIAEGLRGTQYHMIVTPYFPDQDPMDPIRYIVETRSADAVILNQTEPRDERIDYMRAARFPFATHGRTDLSDAHDWFDFDNEAYTYEGVRALVARGRRSALLVAPPLRQAYAQHLAAGMRRAAGEAGIAHHILEGADSHSPTERIEAAMAAHLARHPETDAVVTTSAVSALVAAQLLEAGGRRLGESADVLAKEAVPFLHRFRPEILTVREDVSRAGQFLARAVIARIADPSAAPIQGLDRPDMTPLISPGVNAFVTKPV